VLAKELAYCRAHFLDALQKDGVICLECGRQFKSLPQHLGKHQLSSDDYKAKWGYNRTTPLERLSTRRKKRRRGLCHLVHLLKTGDLLMARISLAPAIRQLVGILLGAPGFDIDGDDTQAVYRILLEIRLHDSDHCLTRGL